jgi:hypothetical protein
MLSMLSVLGCCDTRSNALPLVVDVDLKDTSSSNKTRSPKLVADPMLLLAISSECLLPVHPMDDVDEDFGDSDAFIVDSE